MTLRRALHLDDKHVAFCQVMHGMEVLRDASTVDVESNIRTRKKDDIDGA